MGGPRLRGNLTDPAGVTRFGRWLQRRRQLAADRRVEKLRRRLADLEYNLDKWGFSLRPSEWEDAEAEIEKAKVRLIDAEKAANG